MTALDITAIAWTLLALALIPSQLKMTAPYGRHTRTDWGPMISNRLGWFLMELVSLVVFVGLFLSGPNEKTAPMWVFFALWTAHYVNRSLIFPWRTRTRGKVMPLAITASAIVFNVVNAGINGLYLGWLGDIYPLAWLSDPRFIIGLLIFATGAAINLWSDNRLIALRSGGQQGYTIPRGGLFNRISCPNHFGEIIEWSGFALMCWNLPALSFAIWTAANLIPRAVSHHKWYRNTFPDYPQDRRAVIPALL
jgi:3-oxo-5-alpha-steroid 4-dehydrogenase 1